MELVDLRAELLRLGHVQGDFHVWRLVRTGGGRGCGKAVEASNGPAHVSVCRERALLQWRPAASSAADSADSADVHKFPLLPGETHVRLLRAAPAVRGPHPALYVLGGKSSGFSQLQLEFRAAAFADAPREEAALAAAEAILVAELRRLSSLPPPPSVAVVAAAAAPTGEKEEDDDDDDVSGHWVCRFCRAENSLALSACRVCRKPGVSAPLPAKAQMLMMMGRPLRRFAHGSRASFALAAARGGKGKRRQCGHFSPAAAVSAAAAPSVAPLPPSSPTPVLGCCAYCRAIGPMTRDHIVPRSMVGNATLFIYVCQPCNLGKGSENLVEWALRIDEERFRVLAKLLAEREEIRSIVGFDGFERLARLFLSFKGSSSLLPSSSSSSSSSSSFSVAPVDAKPAAQQSPFPNLSQPHHSTLHTSPVPLQKTLAATTATTAPQQVVIIDD